MQVFSCKHITKDEASPITTVRVTLAPNLPKADEGRLVARRENVEAEAQLCILCTATARYMLEQFKANQKGEPE